MGPEGSTASIVQDYIQHVRQQACEHLAFYAGLPSLENALDVVATWRNPEGKIERHQRRLRRDVKRVAGELIRRLELHTAVSFEAVFQRVQEALGGVNGAGDLAVYDVALRLAAVLGLPPQRVYLHRGSRAGARAVARPIHEPSAATSRLAASAALCSLRVLDDLQGGLLRSSQSQIAASAAIRDVSLEAS